ncbi:MAG: lipocalin family protein [Psychroserpens sp.]|uniref:lipocalin family protein n=1 Tax=Psychroserpens sp. TaxID=2020870 RepID=UPI003002547D
MNHLKKLFVLTFIVITAFACSNDDDNSDDTTAQNQANIIGIWKWVSSTENGTDIPLDECEILFTLTITSAQVTSTDFYGVDCTMVDTFTVDYTINGNTVSITEEGETYTSEITTLNSTTLTIKEVDGSDVYTDTYTRQ